MAQSPSMCGMLSFPIILWWLGVLQELEGHYSPTWLCTVRLFTVRHQRWSHTHWLCTVRQQRRGHTYYILHYAYCTSHHRAQEQPVLQATWMARPKLGPLPLNRQLTPWKGRCGSIRMLSPVLSYPVKCIQSPLRESHDVLRISHLR